MCKQHISCIKTPGAGQPSLALPLLPLPPALPHMHANRGCTKGEWGCKHCLHAPSPCRVSPAYVLPLAPPLPPPVRHVCWAGAHFPPFRVGGSRHLASACKRGTRGGARKVRPPPLYPLTLAHSHSAPFYARMGPLIYGVRESVWHNPPPLLPSRGDVKAKMEGGTMARGRNRVGAGKEAKVCVVTDNLGGQHESRGGTSRQAKGERQNDHTAVSRKARAGAGQGKAGMMRQDEGEHNKTGAGRQVQSKVGWAREIGRMEEENARGDKVRTHLPLREENVKCS
jgi:hypothetical protein